MRPAPEGESAVPVFRIEAFLQVVGLISSAMCPCFFFFFFRMCVCVCFVVGGGGEGGVLTTLCSAGLMASGLGLSLWKN